MKMKMYIDVGALQVNNNSNNLFVVVNHRFKRLLIKEV